MYDYIKGTCAPVIEQLINQLTQLTKFFDMKSQISPYLLASVSWSLLMARSLYLLSLLPWPMVTTDKALNPNYTVVPARGNSWDLPRQRLSRIVAVSSSTLFDRTWQPPVLRAHAENAGLRWSIYWRHKFSSQRLWPRLLSNGLGFHNNNFVVAIKHQYTARTDHILRPPNGLLLSQRKSSQLSTLFYRIQILQPCMLPRHR